MPLYAIAWVIRGLDCPGLGLYCLFGLKILALCFVGSVFYCIVQKDCSYLVLVMCGCHLQRMKMICSSLCSQFNIVTWVWMHDVHVPQPRFQHGDPGTCLMAPGNQSGNEVKDKQMQNPDGLEQAFRNARLLCFSWRALPLLCKNIRQGNITSLVITRVCALKYL